MGDYHATHISLYYRPNTGMVIWCVTTPNPIYNRAITGVQNGGEYHPIIYDTMKVMRR